MLRTNREVSQKTEKVSEINASNNSEKEHMNENIMCLSCQFNTRSLSNTIDPLHVYYTVYEITM